MSPKNDSGSSWLDRMGSKTIDLDALLTPEQFAQWVGESELWVRRRLASLPGVIREGRKHVRIHPRTYLEKRLGTAGRPTQTLLWELLTHNPPQFSRYLPLRV